MSWLERPLVGETLVGATYASYAMAWAKRLVSDQDAFWIAAAGREAWVGRLPRENLFSFTAPTQPWIFHELGFGLVYAKGLAWLGPGFLSLFGIVMGAVTMTLLAWYVARNAKYRATFAIVLLPVLLELPIFHSRPPYASFGFVIAMTALAFAPRFTPKHAALAIGLEWLWTQFHGSFPLGIVLLVFGAIERRDMRVWRFVACGVAALATLANPYGVRLHALVFRYAVGHDDVTDVIHHHIEEFLPAWQAPRAFGPFDGIAVIAIALLALWAIRRGARLRGGFVLVWSALAIYQIRHVHLATIFAAMLLLPEIDRAAIAMGDAVSPAPPTRRATWTIVPASVLGLFLALYVVLTNEPASRLSWKVGGEGFPTLLARVPDGAHVYAPFGISPSVIWWGYPRGVRVSYDARNDCYPSDIALEALRLEYDEAAQRDAAAIAAARNADWAFARTKTRVFDSFRDSAVWSLADTQAGLALFTRK